MSRSPTSRSPDLKRLHDEGYAISLVAGLLVVSQIPFVNAGRRISRGRPIVPLSMAGDVTVAPRGHGARWSGGTPCDGAGRPLARVIQSAGVIDLGNGLVADHLLCNKPMGREFRDYHELVTAYVGLIASHAIAVDPIATAKVRCDSVADVPGADAFQYVDTATARAEVGALSARLAGGSVAIVGLGGTGSYVLDLVAKTPVATIHLFDGDTFDQHNAFRAPGAASREEIAARRMKVDHFAAIYSRMHRGIVPHRCALKRTNLSLLENVDFAFLCLDDARAKGPIIEKLERRGVSFIDVGMGLAATEAGIVGAVRVTTSTAGMRHHVHGGGRIPLGDAGVPDAYASNVQVADLNALNAALAVIRWKRLKGFYADQGEEHFTVFGVAENQLFNEDVAGD